MSMGTMSKGNCPGYEDNVRAPIKDRTFINYALEIICLYYEDIRTSNSDEHFEGAIWSVISLLLLIPLRTTTTAQTANG